MNVARQRRVERQQLVEILRHADAGRTAEFAVLEAQQMTGFRLTEPGGFLQHRLEHRREIAGRGD